MSVDRLIADLVDGSPRALARTLSLIEDGSPSLQRCLQLLFPHTGRARVIGITGSPGAGKSTLVDALVLKLVHRGSKVAVLAVDPTSPFSGGALLGDRIRMVRASETDRVFIRSAASRGALGGVSPRTAEAVFALDAAGYDQIILETVGVGQAEVEIVKTADTVVVTLVPGMGDGVQAMKAGILEIADVFAINKSDYPGTDKLERELIMMLGLGKEAGWRAEIVKTVATTDEGIEQLLHAIDSHQNWEQTSGQDVVRRRSFLKKTLERNISERLLANVLDLGHGELEQKLNAIVSRQLDPITAAEQLIGLYGAQAAHSS